MIVDRVGSGKTVGWGSRNRWPSSQGTARPDLGLGCQPNRPPANDHHSTPTPPCISRPRPRLSIWTGQTTVQSRGKSRPFLLLTLPGIPRARNGWVLNSLTTKIAILGSRQQRPSTSSSSPSPTYPPRQLGRRWTPTARTARVIRQPADKPRHPRVAARPKRPSAVPDVTHLRAVDAIRPRFGALALPPPPWLLCSLSLFLFLSCPVLSCCVASCAGCQPPPLVEVRLGGLGWAVLSGPLGD